MLRLRWSSLRLLNEMSSVFLVYNGADRTQPEIKAVSARGVRMLNGLSPFSFRKLGSGVICLCSPRYIWRDCDGEAVILW